MKVFKVTVMVIDHDEVGAKEIRDILENQAYPNDCIAPEVMGIEVREVDWSDDHPLNLLDKQKAAFKRLFSDA